MEVLRATQSLVIELCKRFHLAYGKDLDYLIGMPLGDVVDEIQYLSWHPEARIGS